MFTHTTITVTERNAAGSRVARLILACLALAIMTTGAAAQRPEVIVDGPPFLFGQNDSAPLPSTAILSFTGFDEDADSGMPVYFRYLLTRAAVGEDIDLFYVATEIDFETYREDLVVFADPEWSPWLSYPADPEDRRIVFPDLQQRDDWDNLIHYLCAFQVMDESGAISLEREYGEQVVNFYVSGALAPQLVVAANPFGDYAFSGSQNTVSVDMVPGQEATFAWWATTGYGAEIVASRWGVDIADPDDPDDPGWGVPPGLEPENWQTPPFSFSSGVHTVLIVVTDEIDLMTRATFVLTVVPIPDLPDQLPLLLVDDSVDRDSERWPGEPPNNNIKYDNDIYRDTFWEDVIAAQQGGVEGFEPLRDIHDAEDGGELAFRDLVAYRSVVWTEKYTVHPENLVAGSFRPQVSGPGSDIVRPYNWLAAYQQLVGNVLMVGSRHQNAFLAELPYTVPIELPALDYPSHAVGLTLLDQLTPRTYPICDRQVPGDQDRRRTCCTLKALVLDSDFRDVYQPSPSAIPDTIATEPLIDWADDDPLGDPPGSNSSYLQESYPFGLDEFYDQNIADCPIQPSTQFCDDGGNQVPCIIPMFRALSRYDWFRIQHRDADDPDWPFNAFGNDELDTICGALGLDLALGRATTRTNDVNVGFLSIKTRPNKPSGKADVFWGFDPYRFDHDTMKEAIRWVLGEHFGLPLRP